jgi:hypothetical protein
MRFLLAGSDLTNSTAAPDENTLCEIREVYNIGETRPWPSSGYVNTMKK